MNVKETMRPGVIWTAPETLLSEIAERMRNEDVNAMPVCENGRVIGMVTDRDIAVRGLENRGDPRLLTARDVMSAPVVVCDENLELAHAVGIMRLKRIRHLPVIGQDCCLVGMLSLADIAAKGPDSLAAETLRAVSKLHT